LCAFRRWGRCGALWERRPRRDEGVRMLPEPSGPRNAAVAFLSPPLPIAPMP